MKKYVFLNNENRIIGVQDCKLFPDAFLKDKEYEFPYDFNVDEMHDYKLIDGQLVYDPISIPEAQPTITERLNAIEALLLDMILEGKIE